MADQIFNVNCGFFDSINQDRLYSAEEMNRPYKRLINNGVFATPQGTPSTDLQVLSTGNGMNIIVKKGEGVFADKWFENPADISIVVPANTNIVPRKDSVIVQIDKTQNGRTGNIIYRTGEPSSNPQVPAINTDSNIIEYRIANIYVSARAVSISQDAISDLRGSDECLWVTGFIKQVDTSELFRQWQEAYRRYYEQSTSDFDDFAETREDDYDAYIQNRKDEFDQFLENLTEDLTVSTNVIPFSSVYVSNDVVSTIPIGIPNFDKDTDVLIVFINGLKITEGLNYSINNDSTNIILNVELLKGQTVTFIVLKSVIGANIQTTITLIQQLNQTIAHMQEEIDELKNQS